MTTTTPLPPWQCCHQPRQPPTDTCTDTTAYRYGDEPAYAQGGPLPDRCGDCAVAHGGLHHPGCCIAQCSTCGQQRFGCDCDTDDSDNDA